MATGGNTDTTTNDVNDMLVVTPQPIVIRAIYPPGSDNLLTTQTIEVPVPVLHAADTNVPPSLLPATASEPVVTATTAVDVTSQTPRLSATTDDGDSIRLGDKIKLILDDALLLKQQECGAGDTENTIIVQE